MNKLIIHNLIIFNLCLWSIADNFAQVQIKWQKCLGGSGYDRGFAIHQSNDGGFILAGQTGSNDGDVSGNHGNLDAWVVKLDSDGSIQWQKCLGGSSQDIAYDIIQTEIGDYFLIGITTSNDGDVSGNHGAEDIWIVKLDSIGNIKWQKCIGGSAGDIGYSLHTSKDGGYIIAGFTYSNDGDVSGNHGAEDVWIVKVDSIGNIKWQKCLGGTHYEEAISIEETLDDGYILCGEAYSNDGDVRGNHGAADYWVVKLDSIGNKLWQKCLGGKNNESAISIRQTIERGYIVSGRSYSNNADVSGNHGDADYWIVKLDSIGELQWQKSLGGNSYDWGGGIQQENDGGYIVIGSTGSNDGNVFGNHSILSKADLWIVKLDTNGKLVWQKCLGGQENDYGFYLEPTQENGYILIGQTESNEGDVSGNHGDNDLWIINLIKTNVSSSDININNSISIYPNPTNDHVIIEVPLHYVYYKLSLKFLNYLGIVFYETKINEAITKLSTKNWTNKGFCIIEIIDEKQNCLGALKLFLEE